MSNERLQRMEDKLDDISEHLWSVDKTLASLTMILDEHQRRSTAMEEQVKPMLELKTKIEGCINLVYVIAAIATIAEVTRMFLK